MHHTLQAALYRMVFADICQHLAKPVSHWYKMVMCNHSPTAPTHYEMVLPKRSDHQATQAICNQTKSRCQHLPFYFTHMLYCCISASTILYRSYMMTHNPFISCPFLSISFLFLPFLSFSYLFFIVLSISVLSFPHFHRHKTKARNSCCSFFGR